MNIVLTAREWLGTPYHFQARGPKGNEGGTDCVGLLIGVAKDLGLIEGDYDPTGYKWETDGIQLNKELARWADCIAFDNEPEELRTQWADLIEEGDILVFRIIGLPQHTAFASKIQYGEEWHWGMIHAYNPSGSVIEHRLDERWMKRLVQIWRLRNG